MASAQQKLAKWRVAQVQQAAADEPTTVPVYAAWIAPKSANLLIRELNLRAPLPSLLGHVKRIRQSKQEGQMKLSIILSTIDREEADGGIVLPKLVSELVDRYSLQPFMATVADRPAKTREEWVMQCENWPTSFHPNSGGTSTDEEIRPSDVGTMCSFMELAVEQARAARRQGQPANGAVIVDPALREVIATGHDKTKSQCNSHSSTGVKRADRGHSLNCEWHPLRHAVMDAIEKVAERNKKLWAAKGCGPLNTDDGTKTCLTTKSHKRQRSSEDVYPTCAEVRKDASHPSCNNEMSIEISSSAHPHLADRLQSDISVETGPPYLCTDCDLYVTREPCAMCAMAMVHQRIRRVIYGIPNAQVGALGSRYNLHSLKSLNHHYTVYQISLDEADLL